MNEDVKKEMDEKYSTGKPYEAILLWDRLRGIEIDNIAMSFCRPFKDKKILDLGSGDACGSLCSVDEYTRFVGTDISSKAMELAKLRHQEKHPNAEFLQMDACELKFGDNSFDIVIAKEVIEHIEDVSKVLSEVYRVLRPGGIFSLTSPNRDSLHLVMSRFLGYKEFTCSNDHIKEYTYIETFDMLVDAGFEIDDTQGIYLMPYWGLNIDPRIRMLTDNNKDIINIMRELGELVGPKYSFCYAIKCIKPE